MIDTQILKEQYAKHFSGSAKLYTAPGRINLIGEHTDYNGGFVFPGAVDKAISAAIRPNGTNVVNLYAIDLNNSCSFDITDTQGPNDINFRYIYGVVRELIESGVKIGGFDAAYGGDVPLGAGMSSSAALECCFANALNDLFDGKLDKMTLARIGQATEHKYIGVKCGIMDQFASMHGREGYLMRLDCQSGQFEYYPWHPNNYSLVLINSCVKHQLVGSPYNERRESCERVAKLVGVSTLRDCSWQQLEQIKHQIDDTDYRRARYVLGEKDRVLSVCDALQHDDYETVGQQMYHTHFGLRDDYEVSCTEIDFLVDQAIQLGVTGSRIMGGGFGGCTINLVRNDIYLQFIEQVQLNYRAQFNTDCQLIPVKIADGAKSYDTTHLID